LFVMFEFPAVALLSNSVNPPPPLPVPGLLVKVAVDPVDDEPSKLTDPPNPLVAVPPLLVNVALPAVEDVPSKKMELADPPLVAAPLTVYCVMLPALELVPSKKKKLATPDTTGATKFWVTFELLVMPAPSMVSPSGGVTVIVNALAPELKVIPATVVFAEMETAVVLEVANVAVSLAPLGKPVFGVQFAFVSQSLEPGFKFQVALPARLLPDAESQSKTAKAKG
jgi:hypothetical protein